MTLTLSNKNKNATLALLLSILRNFLVKGLSVPLSFLSGVMLARFLGADSFGSYGLLLSVATLICAGVVRTLSVLIVRELSAASAKKDSQRMAGVVLVAVGLIGIVLLLIQVASLVLPLLGIGVSPYLLPLAFLLLLLAFAGAFLRGLMNTAAGLFVEQAARPLFQCGFLVFIAAGAVSGVSITFMQGVSSLIFSLTCSVILGFSLVVLQRKKYDLLQGFKVDRSWIVVSAPALLLLGYTQGLNIQLPVLMLGGMSKLSEIADFRVASALASLIGLMLIATNVALGPRLSALKATGDMQGFQHLLRVSSTVVVLVAGPFAMLFVFLGQDIILFFYGDEYKAASNILPLLCLSQFINSFCGPVMLALNMLKRERINLLAVILSLALTTIVGFFLVPQYGAYGAAIAQLLGVCGWNIFLVLAVYKFDGIICLPYIWKKNDKV